MQRETTGTLAGTNQNGWLTNSWNNNYSFFPEYTLPLFARGGNYHYNTAAGIFAFARCDSFSQFQLGFRAVLIP